MLGMKTATVAPVLCDVFVSVTLSVSHITFVFQFDSDGHANDTIVVKTTMAKPGARRLPLAVFNNGGVSEPRFGEQGSAFQLLPSPQSLTTPT